MGKIVEEGVTARTPELSSAADGAGQNGDPGRRSATICRNLNLRCVFFVVFGLAVLVSAVFWFLPLVRHSDLEDLELWRSGASIEASFKLQKPVSQLSASSIMMKLEYDILEEIGVFNSKVVIISLHSHRHSNWTNVVFGVLPYDPDSSISTVGLSILKSSLVELVLKQSNLQLTSDLFGVPSFFQVLKLPGGITIAPQQKVFLLQKAQLRFNFTLSYPIYQIQENFLELKNQLKTGLRLRQHEALYVEFTNLNGSTVSSPVIVQASIFHEVGIPFAPPRVKQLAQVIKNSPARNLGLNNTVFGKVKEIRLSSFLQHSLSGDSPSPAPEPHRNRHHHHGHHHHCHRHHCHHHHHHHSSQVAPASLPPPHLTTNLVRHQFHRALPPAQSHSGYALGHRRKAHVSPSISPFAPKLAPRDPSAPLFSVPVVESPLLAVYFAHVQHASKAASAPNDDSKNPAPLATSLPSISSPSPSPTSSSVALLVPWFLALGVLLMHL